VLKKVVLRLPWLMEGGYGPFVVGQERGFYKAVGLDVSVQEGKGSTLTGQTVASGADDYGYADVSVIASLISQDAPVKVVALVQGVGGLAFLFRPPVSIKSARDLVKYKVIMSAASQGGSNVVDAVLAKEGLKRSDLTFINVDPSAYGQTFLRTPGTVLISNIASSNQAVKKLDPTAQSITFAELGVTLLGNGIIANAETIQHRPEEVRSFVSASLAAWEFAEKNPEIANDIVTKLYPQLDPEISLNQLKQTLRMLHTPNTQTLPLGFEVDSDWQQTLDVLTKYGGLTTTKSLSDYYTNQFLPSR
jgi:NitT/TauT family transport system substrate-binding protein